MKADLAATAKVGSTVPVGLSLVVSKGKPGTHVVRLDVYAPGATEPHRQYSQNVLCPQGRGKTDVPFALSDAAGPWRFVCRDVATGVSVTRTLALK